MSLSLVSPSFFYVMYVLYRSYLGRVGTVPLRVSSMRCSWRTLCRTPKRTDSTVYSRSSKHENTLNADVDVVVVTSPSNVHTYKGYKKKLKKKTAGLDRKWLFVRMLLHQTCIASVRLVYCSQSGYQTCFIHAIPHHRANRGSYCYKMSWNGPPVSVLSHNLRVGDLRIVQCVPLHYLLFSPFWLDLINRWCVHQPLLVRNYTVACV